jgi:multidrug efflux pump subunit AcrA (membrane-fusion protein)
MQSLAFLWFELQMTQQYLREKTFGPAESPANSANLNTPIGAGTLRRASVKRKRSKVLLRIAAYLAIVAFVQQSRSSQLKNSSPNAPVIPQAPVHVYPEKAGAGQIVAEETVSVIHPEKSQAATLQLPGQLSAYTDAPIYAQTSGYLKSWSFDIGAKVRANDILGGDRDPVG